MSVLNRAVVVLLIVAMHPALAFDVSPLVHELSPFEGSGNTTFVVSNPTDRALALEFSPYVLEMTGRGAMSGEAADDALLIFPPSALIPPGAVQTVRVQWDPETSLMFDQSYFVVVDQVAVNLPESEFEGVQILLSFNVVVHVNAPESKVALVGKLVGMEKLSGGVNALVSISNEGTANAFGSRLSLTVTSPDKQIVTSAAELQAKFDDLFFPPGHSRSLELTLPDGPWRQPVSVSIGYDDSF